MSPRRAPPPRSLLLLDDLGQAGWGRRRRLHPSRAGRCWGHRGTGHTAGISVRLLGAAGVRVLTHGCGQHHVRRELPRLAARERARGAAPGHWRSLAGVPVPSPLVLPGGAGRRREGRGGGSPRGAASSSLRRARSSDPAAGVGARGRLPAGRSRSAPGWSGEPCPPTPGAVSGDTGRRAPPATVRPQGPGPRATQRSTTA